MMIADSYVKGSLASLSVDQLDHVASLLVEDRAEADANRDMNLYLRCVEALDDVLDERIKRMAEPKPDPEPDSKVLQ